MFVASLLICFLLVGINGLGSYLSPGSTDKLTVNGERATFQNVAVSVDLGSAAFNVSPQYLSVTIDAGQISYDWRIINFTSPRVINMARALSPALLRIGGTSQDFVIFSEDSLHKPDNDNRKSSGLLRSNFTMNISEWTAINEFVRLVGWDIIFGLNVLLRQHWPNGSWDSTNAELLMDYTSAKGYTVNWELGNEPDLLYRVAPSIPITPEQEARDFKTLKELVAKKSPHTKYSIAGPDVASIEKDFITRFLGGVQKDILDAVTWHHYYTDGHTATLKDFTDVNLLDKFIDNAAVAKQDVKEHLHYSTELWLGETSSCYGGGAPGLSDAFVAGFMWLDKLGIAAVNNHSRVLRQAFIGSSYSLLNSSQQPLPDYWLSLLHKRLVGNRVLSVKDGLIKGRYIRVYAHCAKPPYPAGSVVLLVLNLNEEDSSISLEDTELSSSPRDVYWLSPPNANITSQQVTLNGRLLELVNDTDLPDLLPQSQSASDSISLPSLSFGFYVFNDAKATACT